MTASVSVDNSTIHVIRRDRRRAGPGKRSTWRMTAGVPAYIMGWHDRKRVGPHQDDTHKPRDRRRAGPCGSDKLKRTAGVPVDK